MKTGRTIALAACRVACQPFKDAWNIMTAEQEGTIIDQYKGMEIRVRARRLGRGAWTCTIRICNAPHRALKTIGATLKVTDDGVSQQTALADGFTEAMSLCDLLLEKKAS